MDLEREEGEECEENMEVFDDSSSSPSGTLRNYPLTCKVLYSYKVQTAHTLHTATHPYRSDVCRYLLNPITHTHTHHNQSPVAHIGRVNLPLITMT